MDNLIIKKCFQTWISNSGDKAKMDPETDIVGVKDLNRQLQEEEREDIAKLGSSEKKSKNEEKEDEDTLELEALKRKLNALKEKHDQKFGDLKRKLKEQENEHQQELEAKMDLEEVKDLKRKLEDEVREDIKTLVSSEKKCKDPETAYEDNLEALQRKLNVMEEKHEQELGNLKIKLKEQEDIIFVEDCAEELEALKIKLDDQEEKFDFSKSKIKEQQHLLTKQEQFLQKLKDKIECPVCMDIPRSGPVPICPKGHFVCNKCKRDKCPTCRCVMGNGQSLLSAIILENVDHKCKFDDCNQHFPLGDLLENHEAVCHHRTVCCPKKFCYVKVPLSKLVNHLKDTVCCFQNEAPLQTVNEWNITTYNITVDLDLKDLAWPIHIYEFSGEVFALFPIKSEGIFYFVLVMFDSEIECSRFKIEMIVHEHESVPLESKITARFEGNPLSIDAKQEDLQLYGTSEQLMAKIMVNSVTKKSFCLSFRISKV